MKPWYRVIDCASPNKLYTVLDVRIHAGAGKGFPSVIVRVVNGEVVRFKLFGFRVIKSAEDILWAIDNSESFLKWLKVLEPIKSIESFENLEQFLIQNSFEKRK